MVFYCCLNMSKSPQDPRTLFSILADLNNAIVLMVPTRPPILNCSSSLTNLLGIVPRAPITIDITVNFRFHIFLVLEQGLRSCFSFRFLWFSLCGPHGWQCPLFSRFSFFCKLSLGVVFCLELNDLFVSQNPHIILRVLFSRMDSGLCIYHSVVVIIILLIWEFSTPALADSFSVTFFVSASLKSLALFLVFWLILIMLSFWWSPLLFPSPPVPLSILWYCTKHNNYN